LTEEQKRLRRQVLEASKEMEAAKYKRKTEKLLGKGERDRLIQEGVGINNQIARLRRVGLSPGEAATYLVNRIKWNNVGEKGATVIETGDGQSMAGMGAGFAAGQRSFNSSQGKKGPDGGEDDSPQEGLSETEQEKE
jgi:hypothetical protein